MNKLVVGFEYEWMADGTLRLRFLDPMGRILGQQVVSEEAVVPLQLLMGVAFATLHRSARKTLLKAWRQVIPDLDRSVMDTVLEAARVRATLAPDGGMQVDAFEGEDV